MSMRTHATGSIVLSVLGLAAAGAHAQRLNFDIANPTLNPGESTIITLTASFPSGDYAMAGVALDIVDNLGRGGFSDLALIAPMNGPGTSAGSLSASGIDGIIAGQLNFPTAGIFADPTNPIALWSMTFTAPTTPPFLPMLDIETRTTRFDVYVDRDSARSESRLDDLIEAHAVINFPAPGSAAILGFAAVALRRRR